MKRASLFGPGRQRRRDRRPGALFRGQRLCARLHRLGARRVRHPRRGDRRLPAQRRGAGPPGPVRRHPGIDPRLRSRDPALDQAAQGRRPAAGQRGPARQGRHLAVPHGLSRRPSARRATIRSTPRSASGGRRAGMEHWLPLFYPDMATLFDYLPSDGADRRSTTWPATRRDERLAMIDDAYDAARRGRAQGALPPAARRRRLYLRRRRVGRRGWPGGRPAASPPSSEAEGEPVVDMGARPGAPSPPSASRTASTCSRPTADHARKPGRGRQAGAVRLLVRRLVGPAWAPCWPTMA